MIADAKRGDIDSTAEAYADAWLGDASPLAVDAVTAHPYLGLGALAPLVRLAARNGRGVLVVARSSNPEGRGLQQAVTSGGTAVEDMVLAEVAALNGSPEVPSGTVGAVVGATLEPSEFRVIPARGRNSRARARCPGCRPGRRGPDGSPDAARAASCRAAHGGCSPHGPDPVDAASHGAGHSPESWRR